LLYYRYCYMATTDYPYILWLNVYIDYYLKEPIKLGI
jgi:hypothetical protein